MTPKGLRAMSVFVRAVVHRYPRRAGRVAVLALALPVTAAALASGESDARGDDVRVYWAEHFQRSDFRWDDPMGHGQAQLDRVYAIGREGVSAFLHAKHDATTASPPKAMHYGKAFQTGAPPLDKVLALTWRWRALRHPSVGSDAWEDMSAGVYVIMKTPSLIRSGKGFKFGWLAHAGEAGTHQRGLLQVDLRHDAAGPEWKTEKIDLCALFRKEFGACEGEHVLYVGVVTDADGTKSVAEADYADFQLLAK